MSEAPQVEFDLDDFCRWAGFSTQERQAIAACLDTPQRVAASYGKDWRQLMKEYMEWRAQQPPAS